jgi:hypothetical protein
MFVKKLGIEANEENFSAEFKQKNIQFFKGLDSEDAVVYYATADNSYYDLVTVRIGDKFNSIPAPLFIEWTGVNPENISEIEVITREELDNIIDEIIQEEEKEKAKVETENFINEMTFNSKIGEIIRDLTNGKTLVLDTIRNQYGKEIPNSELYINSEGLFEYWYINCNNSNSYGLGTCHCVSHPASESYWISPEQALYYIREYIEKEEKEEIKKENERKIIAMWLAQATSK